jgi:hypothetical protein
MASRSIGTERQKKLQRQVLSLTAGASMLRRKIIGFEDKQALMPNYPQAILLIANI